MPSWEYSASMSLRAAARAVMRPPSLKNTTPIALKELRSVSWSKSFMTATKFTVAFLCRLPIIDGRTTMKAPFFSPAFCLITSLITACSSPSGPNAWTPVTSGPPRAPIPQNEVLVIDEYRASATVPAKARAAGWTSSMFGKKWEHTVRKTWAWTRSPLMKNLCGFIRAAGNVPGAISCPEFFQLFLLAAPQCGHSAREFPFSI